MSKWNYGDAYLRCPCEHGTVLFENGSKVKVHDLFDPLPNFMHEADMIFVDPPWTKGNINTFYRKADKLERVDDFKLFYMRLFECIRQIEVNTCYVEIGKEHLADFIMEMRKLYKYVTFYNSSYYHSKDKMCYVVRGSNKFKKPKLDYMDEEDIIEWICKNEEYECIADLCMGRGLVAVNAQKNGRRFVGTELNHKRLSVTIERVIEEGGILLE